MMCGKLPFEGDNPYLIRDAKLKGDMPSPSSLNPNISPVLESVLLKSLARNPKERYESAEDMIQAIEKAVMSDETVVIPTVSDQSMLQSNFATKFVETPETTDKKTDKSKSKKPIALIASLIASALTVIAFLTIQPLKDFTCNSFGFNCPDYGTVNLVAPVDNQEFEYQSPITFSWESSEDNNSTYSIEYAGTENFSNSEKINNIKANKYLLSKEIESGSYYWRVFENIDNNSKELFSDTASFVIKTEETKAESSIENEVAEKETVTPPPPIQDGTFALTVNKASSFFLNGKSAGVNKTSINSKFPPGNYNLRIENAESIEKEISDRFSLKSNQKIEKSYTFTFQQASTASLVVACIDYNAQIFMDGLIQEDVVTPQTFKLKNGDYEIKVLNDKTGQELKEVVSLRDNKNYRIIFNFLEKSITFGEKK